MVYTDWIFDQETILDTKFFDEDISHMFACYLLLDNTLFVTSSAQLCLILVELVPINKEYNFCDINKKEFYI